MITLTMTLMTVRRERIKTGITVTEAGKQDKLALEIRERRKNDRDPLGEAEN